MFTSLHRLRVCDIRTWNNDSNGRKSEFPNMVLHCRRLLGGNNQGDESYVEVKFLWISTIGICTTISKRCFDLKLGGGEDAWWHEDVAAFVVLETRKDVARWDENRSDFGMWPEENLKPYPSYSWDL
jgi:hypothetical protein